MCIVLTGKRVFWLQLKQSVSAASCINIIIIANGYTKQLFVYTCRPKPVPVVRQYSSAGEVASQSNEYESIEEYYDNTRGVYSITECPAYAVEGQKL